MGSGDQLAIIAHYYVDLHPPLDGLETVVAAQVASQPPLGGLVEEQAIGSMASH
jgi:hypothetical protein